MTESVFQRVRRIFSAQIEDSVDAMERANSDGTMREAIREVARATDEVRRKQDAAVSRRLQAARQQEMIAKKLEELNSKARFAINEGRDDLAEGALKRQVELEAETAKLDQVQMLAREEEAKYEESLTELKSRKTQMEEALAAFAVARTEASMGGDGGFAQAQEVSRKVEQAEAAFDRAMSGAGGVGFTRGDAEAINQVAELDTLHKNVTVAERLAALKQDAKKAA